MALEDLGRPVVQRARVREGEGRLALEREDDLGLVACTSTRQPESQRTKRERGEGREKRGKRRMGTLGEVFGEKIRKKVIVKINM